MLRWTLAFVLALLISAGLFWFMQWMVMNNAHGLQQTSSLQRVEFIRLKRDTQLNKKQRRLEPKPKPEPQPPAPLQVVQPQPIKALQAPTPKLDLPRLKLPATSANLSANLVQGVAQRQAANTGMGKISSGLIPLVRIPPRYPNRAAMRNLEGWVQIDFTITETGTVTDAVVRESKPTGTFDRAALSAISRWKFKPKLVNGRAVRQRATQRLEFNLGKKRR